MTHDNFSGNRLRGFDSVRGRILPFSYLQAVAVSRGAGASRSLCGDLKTFSAV